MRVATEAVGRGEVSTALKKVEDVSRRTKISGGRRTGWVKEGKKQGDIDSLVKGGISKDR